MIDKVPTVGLDAEEGEVEGGSAGVAASEESTSVVAVVTYSGPDGTDTSDMA